MGSDYLLAIGVILLCNLKTFLLGILCIGGACLLRKRRTIKDKKHICTKDLM